MKARFLWATTVAMLAVIGCLAHPVSAQQAGQQSPMPTRLAIIDLSYIFQHYPKFQAELERLKSEVEKREIELRAQRKDIGDKQQQLKLMTPGTENYRNLEGTIASRMANLQVQVQLQKKEFLSQEAEIYHKTYDHVMQYVRWYADQNGIALVLQYKGDTPVKGPPQAQKPGSAPSAVIKKINQNVVYHHPSIDITGIILSYLKQEHASNRSN